MADQIEQGNGSPAEAPKQAIQPMRWIAILGGGLVVVIMLATLALSIFRGGSAPTESKQMTTPSDSAAVVGFPDAVSQTAGNIRAAKDKAFWAASELKTAAGALPTCDKEFRAKMAAAGHKFWITPAQGSDPAMRFVCQDDNQWAPLPPGAADIIPTTDAQEMAAQRQTSGSSPSAGVSRADAYKARRAEALASTAVSFWHDSKGVASPTPTAAVVAEAVAPKTLAAEGDEDEPAAPGKYDWNAYTGKLYRVFEGDFLETILANRLQGEFTGPVNVMLTTNVYSHNRQHILMPQGTRLLGTATKVSGNGQKRLQVTFNRIIMPDGYSVDLAKFQGLDQQGGSGLTGRVDTHWKKILGVAVLVGAIEGLSQLSNVGSGGGSGVVQIQSGMAQSTSQEGLQVLRTALNTLPTVTVYEGTRVRIWVRADMTLPAYENHTVIPNL